MSSHVAFSDAALEAMLLRRAHRADPGDLRDAAFAALEATRPRRVVPWGRPFVPALPTLVPGTRGWAWVVVAAALMLALVGAMLSAGAWWQQHRPLSHISLPGHDPITRILLATSADEAWTSDDVGLQHFIDGAWKPRVLFPPGVRPEVAPDVVGSLAQGSDGSVWAATGTAVWRLRGGEWTKAWEGDAFRVATGPDGTAWVGTNGKSIVSLTPAGDRVRASTIACPTNSMNLAVTATGTVYLGSFMYAGASGLARYDGHTCELLDPLGNGRDPDVVGLATYGSGGVVANLFDPGPGPTWTSYLVRLEAGRWAVLEGPVEVDGARGFAVDPWGGVWRIGASDRGIERLEGGRWSRVVSDIDVSSLTFSSDGVLWYATPAGIERIRIDPPSG